MKAVSSERMRRIDRLAIDIYGIPSLLLMENAGKGVYPEVIKEYRRMERAGKKPSIFIFCGKGNNGGDGMACGRYLFNEGLKVSIYVIGKPSLIKGDAAIQLQVLNSLKIGAAMLKNKKDVLRAKDRLKPEAIIVDAIFGTGFKGNPQGIYKDLIEVINSSGAYVISVDLPSGLDATTGDAGAPCIRPARTLALGMPKKGLCRRHGPGRAGRVKVIDIGLPTTILKQGG